MTAIRNEQLSVTIDPRGAELQAITSRDGREWLWSGDARYWTGRAPILFPVVGASADDKVKIGGRIFPMGRHGFTRVSTFSLIRSEGASCLFRLTESDATLASFPFRFALDVAFSLEGATLSVTASIENRDKKTMPFGFGFHPAFPWPLPGCEGLPHRCWLDTDEEPRTRRLADGLLLSEPEPSLFRRDELVLDHMLFEPGAIILDQLRSRKISFGVRDRAHIAVAFDGLSQLGIWTKPGAPYLCLEPWHGMAAEQNSPIDLEKRPGTIMLAPDDTRSFVMRVALPV